MKFRIEFVSSKAPCRGIICYLLFIATLSFSIADADTPPSLTSQQINQLVWQQEYGVTDAEINDPAWLSADDDHDLMSNEDELKAGTNPFDATSSFKNAVISFSNNLVNLTVHTQPGKLYVLQHSTDLTTWTSYNPPIQAIGEGSPLTLTSPTVTGQTMFCRVIVQDVDSDGDGVSDWAERVLGFDPTNKYTNGSVVDDLTAIIAQLTHQSLAPTVTVHATKATATQPALNGVATDMGTLTFTRSSGSALAALTVPLTWAGTAVQQVDYYVANPTSITFPANATSVGLVVVPLADTNLKTGVTATVTIPSGSGYLVGGSGTASAVIYPAAVARGTGLTGSYFNGTIPTKQIPSNVYPYNSALFSSAPALTRLDPAIDYDWASGSPGTGINNTYFAVNWQGSVQPEYSETYYFDIVSDDGVKLWVNNQLIIDGWQNSGGGQNGIERVGAISLSAGGLYDIKLQYYQSTLLDFVHLNWYSQSQTKQIIPSARLYPTSSGFTGPPTITSANATIGFLGQPFSFNVTTVSPGGQSVAYSLGNSSGPLPPGLTFDPHSGVISGIPTTSGDYQVALSASNASGTGSSVLDIRILPVGSGITRELWPALANSSLSTIPLTTSPTTSDTNLTSLEDVHVYAPNTGERLRGYFTAPATGNYYFWLAASNAADLWISDNSEPVNLVHRASVVAPGTTTELWNASSQSGQRSPWLSLVQGNKYYFEVIHNTGSSGTSNNLSVAYLMDPTGAATVPATNPVLPRYLITQYDYPVTLTTPGTVYVTNLAPLVGTGSSGSGSATLRLNQAQNQALIHFNYGNLSSPQTSYAIYGPDDSGTINILYDINAVDQFRPDLKTADGGYIWNITGSSAVSASTALADILKGQAMLEVQTVKNPAGEISGKFNLLQGSQQAPAYVPSPSYVDDSSTDAGAARFLNQAAFGAAAADLAYVETHGYAGWIANQRSLPATHLTPYYTNLGLLADTNSTNSSFVPNAWWHTVVTAPDQLRQRVAFALSEIMVTSAKDDTFNNRGNSLTGYYDLLVDNCFGNYRDLLKAVTLHPAMGAYLNMQGNAKGNLVTGYHPDENYAREVMQLFSIGLIRLWPDGSVVLDSQGNPVSTYTQDTITNGFARVFTGWTWHQALQANGQLPTNFYPTGDYIDPMVMVKNYHELGTKDLLDNVVLPPAVGFNPPQSIIAGSQADTTTATYDTYCLGDLDKGLDSIFNHPNVGPFICRELIQRLVESNPSPAYIYRVAQVFNDNGTAQHTRGDMGAVVSAILLDAEARDKSVALSSQTLGKQREPLLRIVSPARTFLASSNSGSYQQAGGPFLTVSTTQPHRLSPNDTVWLDFTGNATGNPPVEPLNDPTTTAYKVVTTPTTSTFTVNTPDSAVVPCTEPAESTALTVTYTSVLGVGAKVYLSFSSNSSLNGIYQIAGLPDAQHFTVVTAKAAPAQGLTDTVCIPRAGCVETTSSSVTNFTITTDQNSNLKAGDHIWLSTSSPDLQATEWVIASVTSLRSYVVTSTTAHQAGSITGSSLFPLVPPPSTRSGVVSLPNGTYSVGSTDSDLSQTPLLSPTVFNYYYPDYKYPGSLAVNNISTPEFQLTTDSNVVSLTNAVVSAILTSGNTDGLSAYKNGSVDFDLLPYMKVYATIATVKTVSGDNVTLTTTSTVDAAGLVNKLGDILTGGMLTSTTKARIVTLLDDPTSFPPDVAKGTVEVPPSPPTFPTISTRDKVRAAVQLILASPEYAIQR